MTGDNRAFRTEPLTYFWFDLPRTPKGLLPETGSVAHAAQEADQETAGDYMQHIVLNKQVAQLQLEGLLLRQDASWCSDDVGLAVAAAYLVLQSKECLTLETQDEEQPFS